MADLPVPAESRSKVRHVAVPADEAGVRLDRFLERLLPDVPRSRLFRLVRRGEVRVNSRRARPELRLQPGDNVRVPPLMHASADSPAAVRRPSRSLVEAVAGCIIAETRELLVINKPAGMAVHGGSGVSFGVIEALRTLRPDETLELVHRLDRDTSGVLLVARKRAALRELHALIREQCFDKRYLALLNGSWQLGQKVIDFPLRTDARVSGERTVRVDAGGKAAVSRFRPVEFFGKRATLLEVAIDTGRTHQIRVHAAHAGHAVAGDEKYGDADANALWRERGLKRMFLHASSISFEWPGGKAESFNAPLADDLRAVLDALSPMQAKGRLQ
ncbi:MAG: RluA family pseudouridine synthase [Steroidobacteraceae bacterium]